VFSAKKRSLASCVYYRDFIRSWLAGSQRLSIWMLQLVRFQTLWSPPTGLVMCRRWVRERQGASHHLEQGPAVGCHRSPTPHGVELLRVVQVGAELHRWLAQQSEFFHQCGVRLHLSPYLRVVLPHPDVASLHLAPEEIGQQRHVCRLGLPSVENFHPWHRAPLVARRGQQHIAEAALHRGNTTDCYWSSQPPGRNSLLMHWNDSKRFTSIQLLL